MHQKLSLYCFFAVSLLAAISLIACDNPTSSSARPPQSRITTVDHAAGFTGLVIRDGKVLIYDISPGLTKQNAKFYQVDLDEHGQTGATDVTHTLPAALRELSASFFVHNNTSVKPRETLNFREQLLISFGDTHYGFRGDLEPEERDQLPSSPLFTKFQPHAQDQANVHIHLEELNEDWPTGQGVYLLTSDLAQSIIEIRQDAVRLAESSAYIYKGEPYSPYIHTLTANKVYNTEIPVNSLPRHPDGRYSILRAPEGQQPTMFHAGDDLILSPRYQIMQGDGQKSPRRWTVNSQHTVAMRLNGTEVSIMSTPTGEYLGSFVLNQSLGIERLPSSGLVHDGMLYMLRTDSALVVPLDIDAIQREQALHAVYFN